MVVLAPVRHVDEMVQFGVHQLGVHIGVYRFNTKSRVQFFIMAISRADRPSRDNLKNLIITNPN